MQKIEEQLYIDYSQAADTLHQIIKGLIPMGSGIAIFDKQLELIYMDIKIIDKLSYDDLMKKASIIRDMNTTNKNKIREALKVTTNNPLQANNVKKILATEDLERLKKEWEEIMTMCHTKSLIPSRVQR